MTNDRTTINVRKEAHSVAEEAKEETETWSDYLVRCANAERVSDPSNEELVEMIQEGLNGTEDDPVDYAEIESRVERVMERMVR